MTTLHLFNTDQRPLVGVEHSYVGEAAGAGEAPVVDKGRLLAHRQDQPAESAMAPTTQACTADLPTSKAFLKLLRWLENYPRDDDGVYWVTYGGGTFSDASSHPNTPHKKWGHTSTAAGAYQIVFGTWAAAKRNGIAFDFMPASQDQVAWWIIGQSRAQSLVCGGAGQLDQAFSALASQWSSLPGASQSQVSAPDAKARYAQYLASFTAPQQSSR